VPVTDFKVLRCRIAQPAFRGEREAALDGAAEALPEAGVRRRACICTSRVLHARTLGCADLCGFFRRIPFLASRPRQWEGVSHAGPQVTGITSTAPKRAGIRCRTAPGLRNTVPALGYGRRDTQQGDADTALRAEARGHGPLYILRARFARSRVGVYGLYGCVRSRPVSA